MTRCLICGENTENHICSGCLESTDMEKLCLEISAYKTESGINPLWDELYLEEKENGRIFKDVVFELTKNMDSPYAEMLLIKCLAKRNKNAKRQKELLEAEGYTDIKDVY